MNQRQIMFLIAAALGAASCSGKSPVLPDVTQATFVSVVNHPYLPFNPGAQWVYDFTGGSGGEHIVVTVLGTTTDIQGVAATMVQDTASVNSVVIEDTTDYYAQDTDGNVWYLGEDTTTYDNGVPVSNEGTWRWGVDGALPGFAMPAVPTVDGQPYRQEYFIGHAEDVGEVIALNQSATTAAGSWNDCVRTQDTTTLDSSIVEHKLYCNGVGLVSEPDESIELTSASGL